MTEDCTFATAEEPLRCSRIPSLMQCTWRHQLLDLGLIGDGDSGKAADTGSAMHLAARAWHMTGGKEAAVAIGVMRSKLDEYPLADLDDAAKLFRAYAADKRNREAKIILLEEKLELVLEPSKTDPTGEKVVIWGTCDQVREMDGKLVMVDLKTGSPYGYQMLDSHAYQLAAYMLGASIKLKRPVEGAAILRVKDYFSKTPAPVIWHAPWGYREAVEMMYHVTRAVALVRSRQAFANPGEHCRWCPKKSLINCSRAA